LARGACTPNASAAMWPRRSARIARPVRESSRVHGEPCRDQHRDPDCKVDRSGIEHPEASDGKRRNAGNAVIAAEEFKLAEQIEQADAPGDGAERQIMSRQPHCDEAEQHRGDATY